MAACIFGGEIGLFLSARASRDAGGEEEGEKEEKARIRGKLY